MWETFWNTEILVLIWTLIGFIIPIFRFRKKEKKRRLKKSKMKSKFLIRPPNKFLEMPRSRTVGIVAILVITILLASIIFCSFQIKKEGEVWWEQADVLPYDRQWFEFPKESLKLVKQLGSGAYGVVFMALAENIIPFKRESVVAVKMANGIDDNNDEAIKALLTELNIMANLEQHSNVVKLLGAVTENIPKQELMIIMEYCRYGNLQNVLVQNRKRFINQINPTTGRIDHCIVNLAHRQSNSTEELTISTSDLVSWAIQVARGMDYLALNKVEHGDLAARNILLYEDNVVKICDFGSATSIVNPCRDIWSFGTVLWEFFSLGTYPRRGIGNFSLESENVWRLEQPKYANCELYDIMLQCWSANPEKRPLFHELEKKFANLLGDDVTNHYELTRRTLSHTM